MSTLKVNNITDTSGGSSNLEVPGAAKAWVNFVGTGTVSIRDNLNVSSITDNGTGDYTVNWNNDFANNDYSAVASAGGTSGIPMVKIARSDEDFAVGSIRMETLNAANNSKFDNGLVCVAAFGD
tara:strand:+ start:761 stop:1132 length:372 start_codon:yes stop_codon:yes gene_type:complete